MFQTQDDRTPLQDLLDLTISRQWYKKNARSKIQTHLFFQMATCTHEWLMFTPFWDSTKIGLSSSTITTARLYILHWYCSCITAPVVGGVFNFARNCGGFLLKDFVVAPRWVPMNPGEWGWSNVLEVCCFCSLHCWRHPRRAVSFLWLWLYVGYCVVISRMRQCKISMRLVWVAYRCV